MTLALQEVPRPSPTNLISAVKFYEEHGLPVTPVRPGAKSGYKIGWSQPGHSAMLADFRADDNVGVLNGTQPEADWFFHDVDIDENTDTARRIVERLLPPTGWRYGRPSKPRSHANYLVKGQVRSRRYVGVDGKVILELRGVTQKKTHTLSVGPGSTHPSGEPIRFCEPRSAIGRIDNPDDFDRDVQYAAVGIVIGQAWPKTNRHHLRLAFPKVLHGHGLTAQHSTAILEAVMDATGSDVSDVANTVRDTYEAISAGESTAGVTVITELLGEDTGRAVLSAIARILRTGAGAVDDAGIVMVGGELSAIVNRAEAALLTDGTIYQRGGILTRPIKLDRALGDATKASVKRDAGSMMLIGVKEPWLVEQMGKVLKWYTPGSDHTPRPADPKPIYARTLIGRGEWPFPVLRGVVTAPTLARDARIIAEPGFDSASGLLVDIVPNTFPPIPENPSECDAGAALDLLARPLRGFPFVDKAAKSVALSAMLTSLVRLSLKQVPLHGYDAPAAGTGKSMLAEMVGLLATGFRPPALSQDGGHEEDEKRLSTVLFAGDPVIHIDNCELPIAGAFLCSMLTQEVVQARILGLSERRILPSTALVLASGNNLTFAGDVSRRAVVCRLDAKVERPDTREFDFDCHAEVMAARPELVVAGLTVLRAYAVAGWPVKLTPMGSFPDWEWIRGALVWLQCADPADTRSGILDADPRKDELLAVMDLWEEAVGASRVEVKDLASLDGHPLIDKLIEIACRGSWNGKSVGWWLRANKDRVVDERSFRCELGRNGQQWWLAGARVLSEADQRALDELLRGVQMPSKTEM